MQRPAFAAELRARKAPPFCNAATNAPASTRRGLVRDTGVAFTSEITRVQAEGFLRNSLRSGDLGADLREQIAASLLSILQKATDFKAILPPTAQLSATLQKIQFQDAGADELGLVIDGRLQLSDEQAKQFAVQLRQNVSARSTAAQ